MGNPNKTGIYGIFCRNTDECLYVGQSGDIPRRWKQHLKLLASQKHPRKDFGEWYAERGADESLLRFVILEEGVDADSLNLRETHWFHKLSPRFFGKQPSLNEKWRHSEATKKKISESMRKNDPFPKHERVFKESRSSILGDMLSMSRREISKKYGIPNMALRRLIESDEDARNISRVRSGEQDSIIFSDQIERDLLVLKERVRDVERMAKDSWTSKQVAAEELKVLPYSLDLFCSRNKIYFIRLKKRVALTDREILDMYFNEKLSTRKIAERANCSQPNVIRVLNKHKELDDRFLMVEERRHLRFNGKPKALSLRQKGVYEKVSCAVCGNLFGSNVIKQHTRKCDMQ